MWSPVRAVGRYEQIRTRFRQSDPITVAHFPLQVPSNGTGARMFYSHGPLQAPEVFELSIILPDAAFDAEQARLLALASRVTGPAAQRKRAVFLMSDDPPRDVKTRQVLVMGSRGSECWWGASVDSGRREVAYWYHGN